MARSLSARMAAIGATLVLSASALAGCSDTADTSDSQGTTEQSVQAGDTSISANDVKAMVDAGDDFVFLDVRTPEEYAEAHISTAENLPVDSIDADTASKFIPSKETPVVVYCRSGHRAGIAVDTLNSLGYTNVKNMGGISEWAWGYVTE